MANPTKEIDWKTLLMCKECSKYKELSPSNRYKHSEWYLWVLWRCKDCIKSWRKTEEELVMARKRDNDRYYNNQDRRDCIFNSSSLRRREKWYWPIHTSCWRIIKRLWIRPNQCPICKKDSKRIEAHHYNYQFPFHIIFCCKVCHSKLDRWLINHMDCDIINIEPTEYDSKVQWIDHKINTTWSCY